MGEKESDELLRQAAENPPANYLAIVGGERVSEKLPIIAGFMEKADTILVGGQVAHTFAAAKGIKVGHSKVEEEYLEECKDLLQKAAEKNVDIVLPIDHIAAIQVEPEVTIKMIKEGETIPDDMMALDIGFATIQLFSKEIEKAGLIAWYAPLGAAEIDTFSAGTSEILKAVAKSSAPSIILGESLLAAAEKANVLDRLSYVSGQSKAVLKSLIGAAP